MDYEIWLWTTPHKSGLRIERAQGKTEGSAETKSSQERPRPWSFHREVSAENQDVLQIREEDWHTHPRRQEGTLRGRLGGGQGRNSGEVLHYMSWWDCFQIKSFLDMSLLQFQKQNLKVQKQRPATPSWYSWHMHLCEMSFFGIKRSHIKHIYFAN